MCELLPSERDNMTSTPSYGIFNNFNYYIIHQFPDKLVITLLMSVPWLCDMTTVGHILIGW